MVVVSWWKRSDFKTRDRTVGASMCFPHANKWAWLTWPLLTEGHARHRRGIKYQPCQNHQNQLLVKLAPSTPLQQQQQTCFYRSSLHFCITLHALGHCKTLEREQHMWCGVTWFFAIKGPLNASWIQNRKMTLFFHSCVQRNRTARMNGSWKQLLIVCALVCAGKKK